MYHIPMEWELCLQVRLGQTHIDVMKSAMTEYERASTTILSNTTAEYALTLSVYEFINLKGAAFHSALDILVGAGPKVLPDVRLSPDFMFWHEWWKLFWQWPFQCSPLYCNGAFPVSLVSLGAAHFPGMAFEEFDVADADMWQRILELSDRD